MCNWCGKNPIQVKHHYPIPKSRGGKEMVDICATCHSLYHNGILVNGMFCRNEKETKKEVIKTLKKCFPLLKEIIDPKVVVIKIPQI